MKRIIFATLIFVFAFSSAASAHSGLTSSSPADGEEVAEDVHEIVLEFNTKIETTSTIKVFNAIEEEIIVSNIQVIDNKMTGAFKSPLDDGEYTVNWKIIGADGHPIPGSYAFVVSQDALVDPVASEETPGEIATPIEVGVKKPIEQKVEDSSKIASNDVLVVILIALFTIAGGFFGWIIGRREK